MKNIMKNVMDRVGCLVVVFGGLFAALALMPVATLIIRPDDLSLIAVLTYAELAVLIFTGGILLASRKSDLWSGLGTAFGLAAGIFIAVYFSFLLTPCRVPPICVLILSIPIRWAFRYPCYDAGPVSSWFIGFVGAGVPSWAALAAPFSSRLQRRRDLPRWLRIAKSDIGAIG